MYDRGINTKMDSKKKIIRGAVLAHIYYFN
jgi:hypothetical protein